MCEWPKNESEYERAYKSLKGSGNLISTLNFNFTVKQKTSQGYFDQVEYSAVVFIPEFFDLRLFGVENKGKHLLFVGGSLINDEHFAKPPYFLEPMYILLKSRNAHISSTREELLNSRESVNFIYESLQRRLVDHVKDILSSEKRDTFVRIYESYVKSGYLGAIRENNSKLKDSFAQILTFTTTSGVEKSETESKKNNTLAEIAGKDICFTNSVDFKSGAPNPIFDGIEGDIILINGLADEQVLNAIGEFQGRKITDVQKLEFGSKKIDSENDPSGFLKDCKAKLKDIIGDVVISSRLKKSPFFLRTDKGQISSTMKKIMGTTGQSTIFVLMMNKKPVLEVNVE
ncbi:Chaperone protein HtpG, partial [Dictyocoela roeselum]